MEPGCRSFEGPRRLIPFRRFWRSPRERARVRALFICHRAGSSDLVHLTMVLRSPAHRLSKRLRPGATWTVRSIASTYGFENGGKETS